jgi:acyl-CoA reductase-like NAD-dependent aldehyde dehydrogenase
MAIIHSEGTTNGDAANGYGSSILKNNTVPMIIGGKDVYGSEIFPVTNPITGEEVWKAGGAALENAVQAVEAAQAALPSWAKTKPSFRRDIFLRAADIFDHRIKELASYQKQETGADDMFMQWILKLTVDNLKEVAGKCSLVSGAITSSSDEGRAALVLKEPYGVVLGIAPWQVTLLQNMRVLNELIFCLTVTGMHHGLLDAARFHML